MDIQPLKRDLSNFPKEARLFPPKNRPSEYVVLDIETTGLSPEKNCIIEIAAVKVMRRHVVSKVTKLCKPNASIPNNISALTGITDNMLKDAESITVVAQELNNLIGSKDIPIFAHNARFDMQFLYCRGVIDYLDANCTICDSVELAKLSYPGLSSYSLGSLAKYLRIQRQAAHRALDDALCTAVIVDLCYAKLEEERGLLGQGHYQSQIVLMQDRPACPRCGSSLITKDGFTQAGSQMYRCKDCGKKYSTKSIEVKPTHRTKSLTLTEARMLHGDGLLHCPKCNSANLQSRGYRGSGVRYHCRDCETMMTFREENNFLK